MFAVHEELRRFAHDKNSPLDCTHAGESGVVRVDSSSG